ARAAGAYLGLPASLLCGHPISLVRPAYRHREGIDAKIGRSRFWRQPGSDPGIWPQTIRSMVMTTQQRLGTKRLVVGAHYGTLDFIVQRCTAVIMAVYTLILFFGFLFSSEMNFEAWQHLFT